MTERIASIHKPVVNTGLLLASLRSEDATGNDAVENGVMKLKIILQLAASLIDSQTDRLLY